MSDQPLGVQRFIFVRRDAWDFVVGVPRVRERISELATRFHQECRRAHRRVADLQVAVGWSPAGTDADTLDTRDGVSNLWRLDLATGKRKQLTQYNSSQIFSFAWSLDGKWLAVARGKVEDDVVLVTSTSR